MASRPLSPPAGRSAVRKRGRCQATSIGLSFLFEDGASKKGPRRWLPKPWPRTAHCDRFGALCAIHKGNVTIALLFQPLNKLKKGPPILHVRGRPLEPIGVLSGGEGGTPIQENKLRRVHLVPGLEKEILAAISAPCCSVSAAAGLGAAGFILPCRPTVAVSTTERRWLGA